MRCLILGGAGFIGSHIADDLIRQGHTVRIFDRPGIDRHNLALCQKGTSFLEGDFSNVRDLNRALDDMECVIHLICTTLPGSSNENPVYDIESNVIGTVHLLDLAREQGVRRIVFASSGGTVYGPPSCVPIPETHATDPICSYGITKLAIEKYLGLYHHLYGLDYCALRIGNPYGERQRSDSIQGVIAVFLKNALTNEPAHIWGDGTVARDFLHISDLVRAFRAAVESTVSGVYNIGSGHAVSLNTIVSIISSVLGKPLRVVYSEARKLDVPVNFLDIRKAEKEMGWKPEISLEAGIRRTVAWLQTQSAG